MQSPRPARQNHKITSPRCRMCCLRFRSLALDEPSIRILTTAGAAQLASDLGYLSSIVMSLNVEYEDLDKWKEYVEMDDAAGRQKVKEVKGDSLLLNVARLRGWSS